MASFISVIISNILARIQLKAGAVFVVRRLTTPLLRRPAVILAVGGAEGFAVDENASIRLCSTCGEEAIHGVGLVVKAKARCRYYAKAFMAERDGRSGIIRH